MSIRSIKIFALLALSVQCAYADQSDLSLQQAVELAIRADPITEQHTTLSQAQQNAAIAAGVLPDPKLKLALQALPTDSFSRNQEPMTQLQIGMVQSFPRGNTLTFRKLKKEELAHAETAAAHLRQRLVKRKVRVNFLDLLLQRKSIVIIEANQSLFSELMAITQSHYAAGVNNQQDVLQSKLQLGMLDERLLQIQQTEQRTQAALGKWIGMQAANQRVVTQLPTLPNWIPATPLQDGLITHPMIQQIDAKIRAAEQDVAIAKEQYKPGWQVGVTYGQRIGQNPNGSDRADFLTTGLTFDVPIFREQKQDKQLASQQWQEQAVRLARSEQLLILKRELEQANIDWQQLKIRALAYKELVKQANDTAQASLHAYQSGVTDFTTLLRARIQELETQLKALRIAIEQRKAHSALLYLLGEDA